MEFKELSVKRGKEHVLEVCTSEVVNLMLPQCDVTIGEACYDDFTSGYNQALKDSKAPEMLEFIKSIVDDYENGLIEDIEHLAIRAELLYQKATEL